MMYNFAYIGFNFRQFTDTSVLILHLRNLLHWFYRRHAYVIQLCKCNTLYEVP
jgi:hypothetical protein